MDLSWKLPFYKLPSHLRRRIANCSLPANAYDGNIMTLKAIIHEAEEGGFWAEVPALPGCFTQGDSLKELEANIHEAIEGWLLAAEPQGGVGEGRILEVAV
jgi:predicted RNase H-like HicB family nuclease